MEKRSYKRISANIRAEFDCTRTICCCKVINLSENGMLLKSTDINFPINMQFEIFVHIKGEVLELPVRVSRLIRTNHTYDGIGIELINPPKIYFEFVHDLRKSLTEDE